MKTNNILENPVASTDTVLKTTALIYLNEALVKEEYEHCRELVDFAKKAGAQQNEISEVISGYIRYIRRFKAGGAHEALQGNNRLNALKENTS